MKKLLQTIALFFLSFIGLSQTTFDFMGGGAYSWISHGHAPIAVEQAFREIPNKLHWEFDSAGANYNVKYGLNFGAGMLHRRKSYLTGIEVYFSKSTINSTQQFNKKIDWHYVEYGNYHTSGKLTYHVEEWRGFFKTRFGFSYKSFCFLLKPGVSIGIHKESKVKLELENHDLGTTLSREKRNLKESDILPALGASVEYFVKDHFRVSIEYQIYFSASYLERMSFLGAKYYLPISTGVQQIQFNLFYTFAKKKKPKQKS